jgi:RNA ligase (TIGR02306 family)
MRKLASIRTVSNLTSIPNSDFLELAHVDGWQCVVKKGIFSVGQLAVYFEIDSFLPIKPEYEFLRKSCFKSNVDLGDGFRIKTIKLRGELSQGLLLPISDIFELNKIKDIYSFSDGEDVTDLLMVKKWEIPLSPQLAGVAKGNFPSFIKKTYQERIQNVFKSLKYKLPEDSLFESSLKLDGSSMTMYYHDGYFGVCSRNLDLSETEGNVFWRVANKSGVKSILDIWHNTNNLSYAIQGELMGPGLPSIRGNREGFSDHKFFIYDIWCINSQSYVNRDVFNNMSSILKKECDLEVVPILDTIAPLTKSLEELLDYAKRPSINHKIAEGVVLRSIDNPNISFKIINNEFLLQEK